MNVLNDLEHLCHARLHTGWSPWQNRLMMTPLKWSAGLFCCHWILFHGSNPRMFFIFRIYHLLLKKKVGNIDAMCGMFYPQNQFRLGLCWVRDIYVHWLATSVSWHLTGRACFEISQTTRILTVDNGLALLVAHCTAPKMMNIVYFLISSAPECDEQGWLRNCFQIFGYLPSFHSHLRWWNRCTEWQLDVPNMDVRPLPGPHELCVFTFPYSHLTSFLVQNWW